MKKDGLIKRAKEFATEVMLTYPGCHDMEHIQRVCDMALLLANNEGADTELVEVLAWLHEIEDYKFDRERKDEGGSKLLNWMLQNNMEESKANTLILEIKAISFNGGVENTVPATIEGKIVQDADRLDALGAVGIARCFAYAGYKKNALFLHDAYPNTEMDVETYRKKNGTAINHFFEKLLLLKDRMNTATGKRIAEGRTEFMVNYLQTFFQETGASDVWKQLLVKHAKTELEPCS